MSGICKLCKQTLDNPTVPQDAYHGECYVKYLANYAGIEDKINDS